MHAFVTGATGFIGFHLVEELLRRQYSVGCLFRSHDKTEELSHKNIRLIHGDLNNPESFREQIAKADIVFHLAGVTKAVRRADYYKGNLETTRKLVTVIKNYAPPHQKLVYLSSQSAGGPCAENPGIDESALDYSPVSAYGQSKRKAEQEVLSITKQFPVVILRPSIVFGPRDRGMLPVFKAISKGLKIKNGFRDFPVNVIYVEDLVKAIVLAGSSDVANGEIFYVTDGISYSWDTLNETIAFHINPKAIACPIPLTFIWLASHANGILSKVLNQPQVLNPDKWCEMKQAGWLCNSTQLKTSLGFRPQWSLDNGIKKTASWYRESGWL